MSRRASRRGWPWDSCDRLAPVLRDLGIDPKAAFERLEWLGRPYDTSPKDAGVQGGFDHAPGKRRASRLRSRWRP